MSGSADGHGGRLGFSSDSESDSDDDLIICLTALYLSNKRQKKSRGTGKISREGLLSHSTSPSACLLLSGTSSDIESFTRLSRPAFEKLLGVFSAVYSTEPLFGVPRSHCRTGSRAMTPSAVLMLTLCYLANGTTHKVNSLLFGVSSSSISRYLNHGLWVLLNALRQVPESNIVMPTVAEVNKHHQ